MKGWILTFTFSNFYLVRAQEIHMLKNYSSFSETPSIASVSQMWFLDRSKLIPLIGLGMLL